MILFFYLTKIFQQTVLFFLRIYSNYVSYFFPSSCRFYPSCSHYAQQAIEVHGTTVGLYLMVQRLLRCHPWCNGGFDAVPETKLSLKNPGMHSPCCDAHVHPQ